MFLPKEPYLGTCKHYSILKVLRNSLAILFVQGKSGNAFSPITPRKVGPFIPVRRSQGLSGPFLVKKEALKYEASGGAFERVSDR